MGPNRSRTSKVQNNLVHVAKVQVPTARGSSQSSSALSSSKVETLLALTELQPLCNKTARTLATALKAVVDELKDSLQLTPGRTLLHILVGDAIGTNGAAARLLHQAMVDAHRNNFKYRLVVLKCGSHQSNLAAASALFGPSNANVKKSDLDSDLLQVCGPAGLLREYVVQTQHAAKVLWPTHAGGRQCFD